jgi:hypothetical protein
MTSTWRNVIMSANQGLTAGGTSTIGGRGFGLASRGLGTGLISIGGGSGATCWLTLGPAAADTSGARGATTLGFGCGR